jgi:phosphate transport system substrate-binding protein
MHRHLYALGLSLCLAAVAAAEPIRSAGCKTEFHLIKALADAAAPAVTLEMGKTGNKKAMQLLAAGQLDLAFTCQGAAKLSTGMDPALAGDLQTVTIARDPLVLIAHPGVGVAGLTLAQVKEIAAGRTTRWSAIGGADLPIQLAWFDASVDSGVLTVFQELTTGEAPLTKPARTLASPEALGAFSASEPGALVILNLNSVKPAFGTTLAIDGKAPERAAVQSGTYPLAVTYHLLHFRRDAAKVRPFLDFVASPAGVAVIDRVMVSIPR